MTKPVLPEPQKICWIGHTLFSAEQMLAFRAEGEALMRERCAQIANHHARRNYPWGSENTDIYHAQAHWAERIAAAIRAIPLDPSA